MKIINPEPETEETKRLREQSGTDTPLAVRIKAYIKLEGDGESGWTIFVPATLSELRSLLALLTVAQELQAALAEHQTALPTSPDFEDCEACQNIVDSFTAALKALEVS